MMATVDRGEGVQLLPAARWAEIALHAAGKLEWDAKNMSLPEQRRSQSLRQAGISQGLGN
jgi:hypothetical protein